MDSHIKEQRDRERKKLKGISNSFFLLVLVLSIYTKKTTFLKTSS